MKRDLVSIAIFVLVSFALQASSHFGFNADHYAEIPFMRKESIIPLGILTMVIQGVALSRLYQAFAKGRYNLKSGFNFGLISAAFFVSYLTFVEPAKYQVPNIIDWIIVEGSVGMIQFTIFGMLLGKAFQSLSKSEHSKVHIPE